MRKGGVLPAPDRHRTYWVAFRPPHLLKQLVLGHPWWISELGRRTEKLNDLLSARIAKEIEVEKLVVRPSWCHIKWFNHAAPRAKKESTKRCLHWSGEVPEIEHCIQLTFSSFNLIEPEAAGENLISEKKGRTPSTRPRTYLVWVAFLPPHLIATHYMDIVPCPVYFFIMPERVFL